MQCCSDYLFKHLVDVSKVLAQAAPGYFIMYGTLLGAWRDQDVHPWETDVDIVLPANHYNSWEEWAPKLEKEGYIVFVSDILRICKKDVDEGPNNRPPWSGMFFPYLDVYKLTEHGSKVGTNANKKLFLREDIYPVKKQCTIRGVELVCVSEPEHVLRSFYGKDWQTPNPMHHKWRAGSMKHLMKNNTDPWRKLPQKRDPEQAYTVKVG